MKSGTVFIYAENVERRRFFQRFIPALTQLGYDSLFLTCNLSNYLALRYRGLHCKLIKQQNANGNYDKESTIINSVNICLEEIEVKSTDYVFIWNGQSIAAQTINKKLKEANFLFFEISNLPGKIFVDPQGVNAKSKLYQMPETLDKYTERPNTFIKWKTDFLDTPTRTPPQALLLGKIHIHHIIDAIGYKLFGGLDLNHQELLYRLRKILEQRKPPQINNTELPDNYIFLPLQVSEDTQIKINSDIDNLGAIKIALKKAKERGVELVVKPHPAETNMTFLKEIQKLGGREGFILSNHKTSTLLKKSDSIITINSTVGLEGLIHDKQVTFLGRTIFEQLNSPERLGYYIQKHLIDIDYFDGYTQIGIDNTKKILNYATL